LSLLKLKTKQKNIVMFCPVTSNFVCLKFFIYFCLVCFAIKFYFATLSPAVLPKTPILAKKIGSEVTGERFLRQKD
jgi:hypothetical protein